jgi:hypothetical protein
MKFAGLSEMNVAVDVERRVVPAEEIRLRPRRTATVRRSKPMNSLVTVFGRHEILSPADRRHREILQQFVAAFRWICQLVVKEISRGL